MENGNAIIIGAVGVVALVAITLMSVSMAGINKQATTTVGMAYAKQMNNPYEPVVDPTIGVQWCNCWKVDNVNHGMCPGLSTQNCFDICRSCGWTYMNESGMH
jgi:hypothetical protein